MKKYGDDIKRMVMEERNKRFRESYMQFRDCIVLCKRCHLLHHKGFDLCPQCKKPKRKGKKLCWKCYIQTPEGKDYLRRKEELNREYAEFEKEEEAFHEFVDRIYELEAQGKHEEALKLLAELNNEQEDDEDLD